MTELSTEIKLFLSEIGSCCMRSFFVHQWSEEEMNMSWAESVGRCLVGLIFSCFLKDLPSVMKLCVNLGLSEMK